MREELCTECRKYRPKKQMHYSAKNEKRMCYYCLPESETEGLPRPPTRKEPCWQCASRPRIYTMSAYCDRCNYEHALINDKWRGNKEEQSTSRIAALFEQYSKQE